jgi:acyl carrier protein phosphodiesterase
LNYLAHAYLSFNDPEILVGNMISDYIKGKKKFDYPDNIQKGIMLHRAIDNFTDTHEATKEGKQIFRPHYRLYGGAFMDVVYDHFLALDENEFTEQSLFDLSQQVYSSIDRHTAWLPDKFARLFPYMKSQNWLLNYRVPAWIARSMEGVVRRSVYMTESATAYELFEEHYQLFQQCYRQFWKDMKPFAYEQFSISKTAST